VARECHSRPSLKEIANSETPPGGAANTPISVSQLRTFSGGMQGKRSQEVSVPMVGKT